MGLWKYRDEVWTSEQLQPYLLDASGLYSPSQALAWVREPIHELVFDMQVKYDLYDDSNQRLVPVALTKLTDHEINQRYYP